MILADTCIWIDHLRERPDVDVSPLIQAKQLIHHPFVTGELALGPLGGRKAGLIDDLALLPQLPILTEPEVVLMVRAHKL